MKLTLSRKLYGVIGILLATLLATTMMSYFIQRYLVKGYEELADTDGAQMKEAKEAQVQLGLAVRALKNQIIRRDTKSIEEFKKAIDSLKEQLKEYEKVSDNEKEKAAVTRAREALAAFEQSFDKTVEACKAGEDIAKVDKIALGSNRPLYEALDHIAATATGNFETQEVRLHAISSRFIMIQVVFIAILAVAGLLASMRIVQKVLRSVKAVSTTVEHAAQGDLTKDVPVLSDDEIGAMAQQFNTMMKTLREMVGKITTSTNTVASNSEEVSATVVQMTSGINQQFQQIEQSAAATTEVSQTIMDVAKNATEASGAAHESVNNATEGKRVVDDTAAGMRDIARTVDETASTIGALGESSKQIGEIITVIQDIADQTNLLALNAAIEAARAGEQGRGFAVVADEVRKLAERTSTATGEISGMIKKIQQDTEISVKSMEEGRGKAEDGVKLVENARESLEKIVSASDRCLNMIQQIAAATEQQSAAIEQVSSNMENVSNVSRSSQDAVNQIGIATNELSKLAGELKVTAAWFRV